MMRLAVVWIHVMAAAAWLGGLIHASHIVAPAAARGGRDGLRLLERGRIVAWPALALLLLTGIENLRQVAITPWLAGKLLLVIAIVSLAAHRDFALLPKAVAAVDGGAEAGAALRGVRVADRTLLLLAAVVVFLAVGVARGR